MKNEPVSINTLMTPLNIATPRKAPVQDRSDRFSSDDRRSDAASFGFLRGASSVSVERRVASQTVMAAIADANPRPNTHRSTLTTVVQRRSELEIVHQQVGYIPGGGIQHGQCVAVAEIEDRIGAVGGGMGQGVEAAREM